MMGGVDTGAVRLDKVKRPGGIFWTDLVLVGQDDEGTWLHGPVGSRWGAPNDMGTLPVAVLVLLAPGRPWAAWWVEDPLDRRLEIDVCQPIEVTDGGWTYVDLELDPVLHVDESSVEIQDWDEYQASIEAGWMSPEDAELARRTAEEMASALRSGDEGWQRRGWTMLAALADGRP